MTIWFDMDGTIANLYGVDNWLTDIREYNPRPYIEAPPSFSFRWFARILHRLQKAGYLIGIVTWGSKQSTPHFDKAVEEAKRRWLARHLPSVKWDAFQFLPHGECKNTVNAGADILFDDEEHNRTEWSGTAYDPCDIKKILPSL